MTYKILIIFCLVGLSMSNIYPQAPLAYKSKWQTRTTVGMNIPVTKLLQGTETDYLLQYDDRTNYWQILSISYFFHKHWGLDMNFQAATSSRLRNRDENFRLNIQSEYSENNYIYPNTVASYNELNFFSGDISSMYLGVIYRLETNRLYVYPKLSIGVTSFYADWGSVELKEKNTNNRYKVYYSTGDVPQDYFTFAPSLSFGYKIWKRFFLNVDITFSYFQTDIVYEKKITNLYTNKSSVQYFEYKKGVRTLSLGTGLIFVIH